MIHNNSVPILLTLYSTNINKRIVNFQIKDKSFEKNCFSMCKKDKQTMYLHEL
ncbi:hypothetical protein GCM10011325_47790 [Dyadobacter sediminis]|nr:hypothetical protein GCM10011325_47790 [Dyadobacter sediminis]